MRGLKLNLILIVFTLCCISTASAQWIDQANPTDQNIQDIFFINDNTGWICGRYNDLFASGSIVKTTNGGANWIVNNTNFDGALFSIHFFDANTGIVTGRNTFKTTDGGNNWTQITMPVASFNPCIYFVNNSTGWAGGLFGIIQKTTNGGNNWTQQSQGLTSETFQGLNFLNASTGWFTGDNGGILKTTDGGMNWQLQSVGASVSLRQIYFSDANTGIVVGNNNYRTTNGGQNWTVISDLTGKQNTCLSFINSSTGWTSGQDGIFFTSDGGASWLEQANAFSPSIRALSALSSGTVYAAGEVIRKTTSAGFNLSAPSNLIAAAVSTTQINLSWTDNSQEDKFMIVRSPNGSGGWALIDSVNAGVTTYQNTGLTSNTDYYYRVYAKKLIWTGSSSEAVGKRTLIDAPVNSSPSNGSYSSISTPTLSWSTVVNATGYNCQVATDANFTNIVYNRGSSADNSQVVPGGILQNSTRYYWRTNASNALTNSDYSAVWSFIIQDPNYGHNMQTGNNLYYFANSTPAANLSPSKPTFNWRDTTGSKDLILNGAPKVTISSGSLDDGRFDLTGILSAGNSVRFFGANYQNVYVGTNGVIGFNDFNPSSIGFYQPASSLPQANITNAIFPLWKDLNFGDADVTVNRLCYKVTANEIIITYMNAPNYNTATDQNDYVSFQVVISHAPSPVINSNINIEYNYTQTGSTFITKYNGNTLNTYLIGLQGTNSASQVLQYRYLNTTPQLVSSGPMFGSNLALAFGPDATLLPVELSSFTSQVNGSNVKLNWSTVNEQNNSGFEIERTNANENNWKKINFVQGNGTTNESKNYSYEERNIISGKYQYRLKQIDFNGNYEYHTLANEVEIGVPKKFALSQNYPNPFNPATKINFELPRSSNVKLSVYDVTGKLASELVNEQRAAGYYTVEFNGANLSSGMYFYRIEAGDFSATKKMMLIK